MKSLRKTEDDKYIVNTAIRNVQNPQLNVVGSIARSLSDKLSDYITVKDFGAKGDGTTDDTTDFLAAVAASAAGGRMIIPPGNYNIDSNVAQAASMWWVKDFGATFPTVTDADKLFSGTNVNRPADVSAFFAAYSAVVGSIRSTAFSFAEYQNMNVSTSASGGGVAYEKAYLFQEVVQNDVSSSAALDLLNMDLRAIIPAANTHGRVWNLFLQAQTLGNGETIGVELATDNSDASTPTTFASSFQKLGFVAGAYGTVPSTAAYVIGNASSTGWYNGLLGVATGLFSNSASSWIKLGSIFRIDESGNTSIGSVANNTVPLYIEANTAITNNAATTISQKHKTSGTATTGFAINNFVTLENASGSDVASHVTTFQWLDATAGSEDSEYDYQTRVNNTLASRFKINDAVTLLGGTAIPAGGTAGLGYRFSSTANFGVFFGSGAPSLSAAQGSLYLRSDGTTTNNRAYINTNGTTGWTALTTAA